MIWDTNIERSVVDIVRKFEIKEASTGASAVVANECKELR